MKTVSLLALVAAAASVLPAQAAEEPLFTKSGTIVAGNALTRETGGVTETVSPCDGTIDSEIPPYTAQGVDGYTIDLAPEGDFEALATLWGKRATLTANRTIPANPVPVGTGNDVDAWFYADGCTLIKPTKDTPSAYHMATTGSSEFGVIPTGARFVVVDLYRGVNAEFAFTIFAD